MIGFFLKKNFFDGWDNIISLVLPNLIIFTLAIGTYSLVGFLLSLPLPFFPIPLIVLLLGWMLLTVSVFAFGENAAQIANFKSVSIKDYFKSFLDVWKDAVVFSLISGVIVFMAIFAIPFYLSFDSTLGLLLAAFVFWTVVICLLSFQWVLPIRSLMHNNIAKSLKKSFLIFFDNPGFSLFIFLYTVFLLAVSVVFFFIIPGATGIVLAHTNALRLRLYKYDWLEEHPDATPKDRKHIPWQELLAEDRENVGPRDFKSFIFPWK